MKNLRNALKLELVLELIMIKPCRVSVEYVKEYWGKKKSKKPKVGWTDRWTGWEVGGLKFLNHGRVTPKSLKTICAALLLDAQCLEDGAWTNQVG